MKAPEIPFLQKGQRIKDWRWLYTAATSGLKPAEQIAFLPLYVGRNGRDTQEQSIVAMCSVGRTELEEVLDELEAIVDGAPSRMDVFNDVFDLKPKTTDFSGLTNFYFRLIKEGEAAGMTYDLIFMRFLKFVKNGRKFYEEKKQAITVNMTSAQTITLFKALQAKLIPSGVTPDTKVKEEGIDQAYNDYYAFQVDKAESEKMPRWAQDLRSDMRNLEIKLTSNNVEEDYLFVVPGFWFTRQTLYG